VTTSAAVFVAAAMNAVTGVGALRRRRASTCGRRGGGLEGEPGDDHRETEDEQRVVCLSCCRDRVEVQLPGGAIDELPSRTAGPQSRSRR